MIPREPMPSEVKRALRKEAFFGCCRCGFPVYQYHHIIPYDQEPHFRPDDMMILCPNCHDMATKGALSESRQRKFKGYPFNRKHGYVRGIVHIDEVPGTVLLSDTSLVDEGCFVSVGQKCLVSIEIGADGELALSLSLYDKGDNLLVEVERSEWTAGDPSIWDLESDHQFLKLRSKPHDILLEIDARKNPLRVRAQLWYSGTSINCKPSRMILNTPGVKNVVISGGEMSGHRVAVSADGRASGIIPMNVHPDDPLFGVNARRKKVD
jgi:hypothetical protein